MASGAPTEGSHSAVRIKQVFIILFGVILAGVMVFLGLWQMNVFESQRDDSTPVSYTHLTLPTNREV